MCGVPVRAVVVGVGHVAIVGNDRHPPVRPVTDVSDTVAG